MANLNVMMKFLSGPAVKGMRDVDRQAGKTAKSVGKMKGALGAIGVTAGMTAVLSFLNRAKDLAIEQSKAEVQLELSREVWELALLSLAMTLIIITGGIDLSVGSTMGICSVALGLAMHGGSAAPQWNSHAKV